MVGKFESTQLNLWQKVNKIAHNLHIQKHDYTQRWEIMKCFGV